MDLRSAGLEEKYQTPRHNRSYSYEEILNGDNNALKAASDGFSNQNREEIKMLTLDKKAIMNELRSKGINDSPLGRMNMQKCIHYNRNMLIFK